ncbi:MAG: hypothetical protein SAK42_14545, partial [Oscillatoria sp. PMC 1076.18]|nr:hypothetical protein [Oscillatoria sp. PMC 1076.18]
VLGVLGVLEAKFRRSRFWKKVYFTELSICQGFNFWKILGLVAIALLEKFISQNCQFVKN